MGTETETVPDVADLKPLNGMPIPGNPNPSSRWRWISKGVSDGQGGKIRLQVWYVSNRPFTTAAAVSAFLQACTEAHNARNALRAQRAADVTSSELQEVGL